MEEPRQQGASRSASRISVVLATYNGDAFLTWQLRSLAAQAVLPDELVIVDDASSDGTPALLQQFADEAPFPVDLVLRKEHLGTWATFEEGLRRATGDVLLICDQDDIWREHKVAVVADRMDQAPDAGMGFSDARLIDPGGKVIGQSRWRVAGYSHRHSEATTLDPLGQLFTRQAVSGCTMAVRSDLLGALLPFPVDIHPGLPSMMYDRWISLVAAVAGDVVPIPERLVDYRLHPGQQIGIPGLRIRRFAPRAALLGAQFLHPRAEVERRLGYHLAHLDEIDKRLDTMGLATADSESRLAAAREHLQFRESLERPRRRRIPAVARELRNIDGYRRFSLGIASALADVAR